MRKTSVTAVVVAALLLVSGLVWSAGNAEASKTQNKERIKLTMTFWGSPMEKKAIEDAVASYEKKMGYVDVETIHVPSSGTDFLVKLNAMIASGKAPDISYSGSWKNKMGEDGLIYNFYDLLAKDPIAKNDDWLTTCWWNWAPDKSAGPIQANVTPSLMYNVDMFKEAGVEIPPTKVSQAWSWDKFVEVARRLTVDTQGRNALDPAFDAKNIKQFGVMFALGWASYMPFVYSNGGDYLSKDRRSFGLTDPAAAQAIQRIADLINVYHVHPSPVQKDSMPAPATALQSKKIAMYIDGSWNHLDLAQSGINWGVGVLPIEKNYTTFLFGGSLIIFKSTKHLPETWELYKWITNPDTTLNMFQSIWMPVQTAWYTKPELIEKWASEKLPARPSGFQDAVMRSAFEHQRRNPELDVINFPEIDALVSSALDQVWLGTRTATQALTEVKANVDPLVKGMYFKD